VTRRIEQVLTGEAIEQRGACRVVAGDRHRVRRPHTGPLDLIERRERVLCSGRSIGNAADRRSRQLDHRGTDHGTILHGS